MRIFVCCCGSGNMAAVGARKGSGREEMNAGENKVKWENKYISVKSIKI